MQRISPSPDDELDLTNGYVTDLACEESTLRFSLSDVLISPQHSMNDRKKYALCECTVIFVLSCIYSCHKFTAVRLNFQNSFNDMI